MSRKPSFVAFVLWRFIAAMGLLVGGVLWAVYVHRHSETLLGWVFGSIAVAGSVLTWLVYRWAKRIAGDLERINRYLETLEGDKEAFDTDVRFFTREFDAINRNLLQVLKKAKKREEMKRRYNAKLKLKNRQRADMLSAIAHEFRNPVAAIMGYAQTLQDEPDIPSALRMKFLQKIHANGEKIEGLLSRLVLWNKFESKQATLHRTRFDLRRLAEEVSASLQDKYKGRTVRLEGKKRVMIDADRTLTEIVLKNLIENALKYSKEDVTVRIDDERLCVIDRGVGIAKKDIDKVTKKFYRSKTHSWNNSMGLGLSIVKAILKLHKSKLFIESEPGKGSMFCFRIRHLAVFEAN